jgi:uncharacterized phage protein gp47/JayE
VSGPVPDLKRNVSPPVQGSECCDCCEGIEAQTPQAIDNPVGLTRIGYRVGGHAQFRASLHAALSSFNFGLPPGTVGPLTQLLTRDDSDFTIGLIDAFACSADLLTFYQERIATESYLLTAVERVSVQEMGKLVGYELKPGLAAETWLAFALETPPVPPADLPPEPGNFVTGVPTSLRLEAGLKVQSVPGPDEKPQTFELVEALEETRPEWNAIRPWLSDAHFPDVGDKEAWLAGTDTLLKPGDGLLLVGSNFLSGTAPGQREFRVIGAVEPDDANGRTRVSWAAPLTVALASSPGAPTFVYALRIRCGVFGNNAPSWAAMTAAFRKDYADALSVTAGSEWPSFSISKVAAGAAGGAVDLESLQTPITGDLPAHPHTRSFAVLATDTPAQVGVYNVTSASDVSRGEFAIAAKVTRLNLAGANLPGFYWLPRETRVYAASELLDLAERPVDSPVGGNRIPVSVAGAGLSKDRRVIVRGALAGAAGEVTAEVVLVAAHAIGPGRAELEIATPFAAPLRRDSVVVHANVALATHGESVSQILGSGAGGQRFQRFELKQLPLTYRAAGGTGATAELVVRVGGIAWRERASLFDAAPTERAYTLDVDEQGRTFVTFGDGTRGARLPSGINNVVAQYRRDLGAAGNVAAETLTQLMTRPLGLKSVSNPLPAEGGTDPEDADAAREAIRRGTRTLERVVSVLDYEDFALAYTGIAKAQARVLNLGAGPTIAITLAPPAGTQLTSTGPVATGLLAALTAGGDPHVSVTLLPYLNSHFQIGIRVRSAADYESDKVLAAVEAALRSSFSFDKRALGQPVHQSEVIAVAQAVPGVVALDLTLLYGGTEPGQQQLTPLPRRLLAKRMHVAGAVAQAAELLTLDPGPLAALEEMP